MKILVLCLLCLSSVSSMMVTQISGSEKDVEPMAQKRHDWGQPTPCPPMHSSHQGWQMPAKTSGWQPTWITKPSIWQKPMQWQDKTEWSKPSGWQEKMPMQHGWQEKMPMQGWEGKMGGGMPYGWQEKPSWPMLTGWGGKSDGWKMQSGGWEEKSGWQMNSGWQEKPVWQTPITHQKIIPHKPMFSYAPLYHKPMTKPMFHYVQNLIKPCPPEAHGHEDIVYKPQQHQSEYDYAPMKHASPIYLPPPQVHVTQIPQYVDKHCKK